MSKHNGHRLVMDSVAILVFMSLFVISLIGDNGPNATWNTYLGAALFFAAAMWFVIDLVFEMIWPHVRAERPND